jgi:hypothetical protein
MSQLVLDCGPRWDQERNLLSLVYTTEGRWTVPERGFITLLRWAQMLGLLLFSGHREAVRISQGFGCGSAGGGGN